VEDEHLTRPVTSQEICIALQSTKSSKAAGPDGIFPNLLKHLGKQAIAWLLRSESSGFYEAKYPRTWNLAKVTAIQKPGKPETTQLATGQSLSYAALLNSSNE